MQPKAKKNWGQSDKDLIVDLVNRQLIDLTDTTLPNMDQVRQAHFWHHGLRNFRRNYRDFSSAWDLEIEYSGAGCIGRGGKMMIFFYCLFFCNKKHFI